MYVSTTVLFNTIIERRQCYKVEKTNEKEVSAREHNHHSVNKQIWRLDWNLMVREPIHNIH